MRVFNTGTRWLGICREFHMKPKHSILLVASSCLIVSCNRSSPSAARSDTALAPDVLAAVEGQAIRLADFEAELERRSRGRRAAFARPEEREALLHELVTFESIYFRAKAAGFDQRPEIARQIKSFIIDRFIEEHLKDKPDLPPVSETEIAAYYRGHPDRFAIPEQVRFAVVQMGFPSKGTDERKSAVIRKAEAVLAEARTLGAPERAFGVLAQRHSEDQATRYTGGDAGWVAYGDHSRWAPAVMEAAFALANPGDLSPVVATSNGCYLVRLIGRKAPGYRPLDEVKEPIRYQLAQAKRQSAQQRFFDSMKAGLKIEINHALLHLIARPPLRPDPTPPAMPGS